MKYEEVVARATATDRNPSGAVPYPYQRRLAHDGLPELLCVPTGMGKSLAVLLAWVYRRRFHPDPMVRSGERSRLVLVLPMRVLVEQLARVVRDVVARLDLDIDVHVLMGGEPMTGPYDWRSSVERETVIIGTVDMVLSRCLNRGYGANRYSWPMDFGFLNNGSHFVFDEIQLLGPALPTARQLQALRDLIGTVEGCSTTYMSATVDRDALTTVDAGEIGTTVELEDDDMADEAVRRRLDAPKRYSQLPITDEKHGAKEIAQAAVDEHRAGTLTLIVVNTVARAIEAYQALNRLAPTAETVLLHSRYRPPDRQRHMDATIAPIDPNGPGRIVFSTQVIEAGVDTSAATLITEAAPWSSIVQRAGRCNRGGEIDDARILWVELEGKRVAPYDAADVEAACGALAGLEGEVVTSRRLLDIAVAESHPPHLVLRRKDLYQLFDTMPDISGNDVDVARYIRDSDDLDAAVAWRDDLGRAQHLTGQGSPRRDERCPVPIGDLRRWVGERSEGVWRWDVQARAWLRCTSADVRPGVVLLADSGVGGYDPKIGWAPKSRARVDPVVVGTLSDSDGVDDLETGDDPISVGEHWVTLADHLSDTERAAEALLADMPARVPEPFAAAVTEAARLHDIGKAHAVFRDSVTRVAERVGVALPSDQVFAKTGAPGVRLGHERKGFRHELASALWLLACGPDVIRVNDVDLVTYLVAAHHGRVRMGLRSLQDDLHQPALTVLGVSKGDHLDELRLDGTTLPSVDLVLDVMELGGGRTGRSWSDMALSLLHRPDLGPFRLGYLEAIVRLADWRASAAPTPFEIREATHV